VIQRYSSKDTFRTLDAIYKLLWELPCHGKHEDSGKAFQNLIDLVGTERQACAIRAAASEATYRRDKKKPEEGTTYVH
jgi:hypothetical protein